MHYALNRRGRSRFAPYQHSRSRYTFENPCGLLPANCSLTLNFAYQNLQSIMIPEMMAEKVEQRHSAPVFLQRANGDAFAPSASNASESGNDPDIAGNNESLRA